MAKELRICDKGHKYYKSSSCPVCPVCEQERVPADDFLKQLSTPARRALENAGITTLQELAQLSEAEVLSLHGIGPTAMPKLKESLSSNGLAFRQ